MSEAKYGENNLIDLGYMKINSEKLTKNLRGAKRVYTFAATIGHGADRLLAKQSKISSAKYFVTDGLSSAFAEALADYANKYIAEGKSCYPRFSPASAMFRFRFSQRCWGRLMRLSCSE